MNPLLTKHARELRDTWQARALAESTGQTQVVVLAILFHGYIEAMQVLLRVVFPNAPRARNGWTEISRPFFVGGAQILPNGKVACNMVGKIGNEPRPVIIYESQDALIKEFRDLADRLKLDDADRIDMLGAVAKWMVADRRVDHLGNRLAS